MTEVLDYVEVKEGQSKPLALPNADICGHRGCGMWQRFDLGREPGTRIRVTFATADLMQRAVMVNVKFHSDYESRGCGGHYTGHAIGALVPHAKPNPEQLKDARRLRFDNCLGAFYDKETSEPLKGCTALFLLPGLKARYIP